MAQALPGFPAALPGPLRLHSAMQAMAMLDAILCPVWEDRFYSFNAGWGTGEQLGSVRNSSGDDLFALFTPAGCFVKAFEHETWPPLAAADVYRDVPDVFRPATEEPAFSPHHVTFCGWHLAGGAGWQGRGKADSYLLDGLDGEPQAYKEFVLDYLGVDVALGDVAAVFAHTPLNPALVRRLNGAADVRSIVSEAAGIGYPVA